MKNKIVFIFAIFLITQLQCVCEVTFYSIHDFALHITKKKKELQLAQQIAQIDIVNHKFSLRDFFPTINFSYADTNSESSLSYSKKLDIQIRQKIFDGGKQRLYFSLNSEQRVLNNPSILFANSIPSEVVWSVSIRICNVSARPSCPIAKVPCLSADLIPSSGI